VGEGERVGVERAVGRVVVVVVVLVVVVAVVLMVL
jgi:hypothetical protein